MADIGGGGNGVIARFIGVGAWTADGAGFFGFVKGRLIAAEFDGESIVPIGADFLVEDFFDGFLASGIVDGSRANFDGGGFVVMGVLDFWRVGAFEVNFLSRFNIERVGARGV